MSFLDYLPHYYSRLLVIQIKAGLQLSTGEYWECIFDDGIQQFGPFIYSCVDNLNQMQEAEPIDPNTSLEEHLTNSIRRAKERIYNNAISNYSQNVELSHSYQPHHEGRHRVSSQRNTAPINNHKQQRNVLASAMRTLQEKIAQLERENRELHAKVKQPQVINEQPRKRQQREETQTSRLKSTLTVKQQEIRRMMRENSELSNKNADLIYKVEDLEAQLEKIVSKQLDFPSESDFSDDYRQKQKEHMATIQQQGQRIVELEVHIRHLQQQNRTSQEAIDILTKKLEEEKKINMRWIKLHESQLGQVDQKQNNSLQVNAAQHAQPSKAHPKKQEMNSLVRKNKEMFEVLQRNKTKIADLTKQCKQYEQKFTEMKLIALQIVDNVNKVYPHQGSHIKYLTTKILKLQNNHLQSLRSFSNNARKSRIMQRNSNSKERKRSLKMEDLNSSAKKSREGSHSKSHKKKQPIDEQIGRSDKKGMTKEEEEQLQKLQKEVHMLMKKYRNHVMKGERDKNNEEIHKKIEEASREYEQKRVKYEQLKKRKEATRNC